MNTDSLRLFTEVARKGSFASAAADRGINPSSVSRTIGQLEDGLGVRLFQRTTRRMTLTESGAVFYRRITGILDELDQASEQARSINACPQGTLRLTASVAFGERMIVPLLPDFRGGFPDLKLELVFTDANVDLVSQGIDLAIRLAPRLEGDVVASRLRPTHYRVVAGRAYVERSDSIAEPEDLQGHPCVVFSLPAFRSAWRFRRRGPQGEPGAQELAVPISAGIAVSSALSLRSIVLDGAGPALLADWLVSDDIADGNLIDLFPDYDVTATDFDTAAWLVYPSRSYLPQKVRVTIDFLRERLAGP